VPDQAVYAGTKNAARAISEGLRQEAGDSVRVTTVSPGFVYTDFAAGARNPDVRAQLLDRRDKIAIPPAAIPPAAIARAIAFAIEQPTDVDVNENGRTPNRTGVTPDQASPANGPCRLPMDHRGTG